MSILSFKKFIILEKFNQISEPTFFNENWGDEILYNSEYAFNIDYNNIKEKYFYDYESDYDEFFTF